MRLQSLTDNPNVSKLSQFSALVFHVVFCADVVFLPDMFAHQARGGRQVNKLMALSSELLVAFA